MGFIFIEDGQARLEIRRLDDERQDAAQSSAGAKTKRQRAEGRRLKIKLHHEIQDTRLPSRTRHPFVPSQPGKNGSVCPASAGCKSLGGYPALK